MSGDFDHEYAVLLAGGSGTRLWPVSRELFPKQLVNFIGPDSLVQSTLKRLLPIIPSDRIRVVCGQEHSYEIRRHMDDAGVSPEGKILCEPCGRNTAPAVLLALLQLLRNDPEAVVGVFPADHVIRDGQDFGNRLCEAMNLARAGHIVAFGITPHYPETGYGYIEAGSALAAGGLSIRRFVEKPDLETAEKYLKAGNFYWNSGMFAFKACVMLDEFSLHCPELTAGMKKILSKEGPVSRNAYESLPSISLDYAIMEKTDKGAVLPSDFGWSDIGSWKSLYDFLPKDAAGNVFDGDVIARKTQNCFVMSYERLIAVNRLEGIVVVETPDSVFVSEMEESRDVKEIVARLKTDGRKEYQQHRTRHEGWGTRTTLEVREPYTAERLTIYRGQGVDVESGRGKIHHLVVVQGHGVLEGGTGRRPLMTGDNAAVVENDKVRIVNDADIPLRLILVQCLY